MTNEQQTHDPAPDAFGSPVSPADVEGAKSVLRKLCALAGTAMGVHRDHEQGCPSIDDLEHRLQLMRVLVDRMGWVADVALRKLGDRGLLARPEDWMLPEA